MATTTKLPIDPAAAARRTAELADQSAQQRERDLNDQAELARIKAAESGAQWTLRQEWMHVHDSTGVAELRQRRLRELLVRRESEITLTEILSVPDLFTDSCLNFLRGWTFDAEAGRPVPDPNLTPARPVVTLRRTDSNRSFTYVTGSPELTPEEAKRLARQWSTAPAETRGPDPQDTHILVEPRADGTFDLRIGEAIKCLRQWGDDHRRARARRDGREVDRPIVVEVAAAAEYRPVVPRKAAQS